jgi:DNA-directed RNA polymerase subunit M/transcription elongation factor TFIIS
MNDFCTYCRSMLTESIQDGKLMFHCDICNCDYPSTPEQTLLIDVPKKKDDLVIHKTRIDQLTVTPESSKIIKKCEKCGYTIHSYGFVGADQRPVFKCDGCGNTIIML